MLFGAYRRLGGGDPLQDTAPAAAWRPFRRARAGALPGRLYNRQFLRLGAQESKGKGHFRVRQGGARGGPHRRVAGVMQRSFSARAGIRALAPVAFRRQYESQGREYRAEAGEAVAAAKNGKNPWSS